MVSGPKKVELSKPPRYVDTHVADIYPVTKLGDRIKILSSKDKFKVLFQVPTSLGRSHIAFNILYNVE